MSYMKNYNQQESTQDIRNGVKDIGIAAGDMGLKIFVKKGK